MKYLIRLSILAVVIVITFNIMAFASIFDWNAYESDNFVIFFPDGYKYQAEEVLYYIENYREKSMDLVGNGNNFKPLIILQNAGLESNGFSNGSNNKIYIYTNNPSTLARMEGLEDYNSWFKQLAIHEFTHLAQMTNATGFVGSLTKFGGNLYSPNMYIPGWLSEGIAVYNESKYDQYVGRLNNGYFESYIAARAKIGKIPDLIEVTYGNNEYIYGAKFIDYLANNYGEDKLTDFFKEHSDNYWLNFGAIFPSLGIDNSAKKVYDNEFPELYQEWQEYEEEYYHDWDINGNEIVENKEGKISNLTIYKDRLYYIKDALYHSAPFLEYYNPAIMEYDLKTKEENEIVVLDADVNASLQVVDDKIYYSTVSSGVGRLHNYNLQTGERKNLLFGVFKDYAVLENGDIIYVKDAEDGFGSEIWKYDNTTIDINPEVKKIGRTDQLISEIISYQDRFIVVSKERFGSWNINYLAQEGDIQEENYSNETNNKSNSGDKVEVIKDSFVTENNDYLSEDGKGNYIIKKIISSPFLEKSIKIFGDKLVFTANYDNKYAVYQYDLKRKKLMEISSGSYANDGIVKDENLYFVSVTDQGEGIYQSKLMEKNCCLPPGEVLEKADIDSIHIEEKSVFLKNLSYLFKPYIRFPYLQGEDGLGLLSYQVNYLNNMETVITKDTFTDKYRSISIGNYEDNQDGERKTIIQLHYEYNKGTTNIVLGEKIIYLDANYVKGIDFKNSSISFIGTSVYGVNQAGIEFIPGGPQLKEVMGLKAELNYTHKLMELRKGMWNPNIFINSIFGGFTIGYYNSIYSKINYDQYYPYSDLEELGSTIVYSYELLPELTVGFNQKLLSSFGVRYYDKEDDESDISLFFNINLGF